MHSLPTCAVARLIFSRAVRNTSHRRCRDIGQHWNIFERHRLIGRRSDKRFACSFDQERGRDLQRHGNARVPISDEQLKNLQSLVDSHQARFNERVASGRKMSATKAKVLADGKVYDAAGAKSEGLIDAIGNWDDALAKAQAAAKQYRSGSTKQPTGGNPSMSTSDNPIKAWNDAIAAEMKAANCDKQTAAYRIRRRHPEMATAVREYANSQTAQPQASQANQNPYWSKVHEIQRVQGITRGEAMKIVNRTHSELREHL